MTNAEKRRQLAEKFYTEDGWTAKQIAEAVSVNEKTVGTWVKKYGWKDKKLQADLSPAALRKKIMEDIERITKGEAPEINADALAKHTAALAKLDKTVTIPIMFTVMTDFHNWLSSQDIDVAILSEIVDWQKEFLEHKIQSEIV